MDKMEKNVDLNEKYERRLAVVWYVISGQRKRYLKELFKDKKE